MLEPVPAKEPPQEPVNHCQVAPLPRLPPVTESVLVIPLQLLLLVIDTLVGAVDVLTTATASNEGELAPQLLPAITLRLPLLPAEPVVTIMDFDP
jgi:hypothetical protein